MNDAVNQILINSSAIPGVSLKKGPDSTELLLKSAAGSGRQVYYSLFEGITIAFVQIDAPSWPEAGDNATITPFRINYCLSGRGELLLKNNTYIYLQNKDICISEQTTQREYLFPTRQYKGISIYFDMNLVSGLNELLRNLFDINIMELREIYCSDGKTYTAEVTEEIEHIFDELWKVSETFSVFYMKQYVLELLHLLSQKREILVKPHALYTGIQVEIAKQAEKILTSDLRRHYPVRILAEKFSVSETSLKNYFRGVYGQNISLYLRDIRMCAAAKMLTETQKPISEISQEIGYTNQGKFAALFRQKYKIPPLEYRRTQHMKKMKV